MAEKVYLSKLKEKPEKNVKITSFKFDEKLYNDFKKNLKEMKLSITEVLSEFMKRTNEVFRDGGGEVVFGINPDKKEEGKRDEKD